MNTDAKVLSKGQQVEFSSMLEGLYTMTKWVYFWNARIVQGTKINQCNTPQ